MGLRGAAADVRAGADPAPGQDAATAFPLDRVPVAGGVGAFPDAPSVEKPWVAYLPPLPFEGVLASGRASYLFNNAQRYSFSISPEDGRTIELGYERFDTSIGSDLELNKYTADWHEYINFPWPHHVLQVRAFAGTSTGQRFPQSAFQLGGDMPGDVTLSINDRHGLSSRIPLGRVPGTERRALEPRVPDADREHRDGRRADALLPAEGCMARSLRKQETPGTAAPYMRRTGSGRSAPRPGSTSILPTAGYPLTLRLGIARGLDENGVWQLIWNAWVPLGF